MQDVDRSVPCANRVRLLQLAHHTRDHGARHAEDRGQDLAGHVDRIGVETCTGHEQPAAQTLGDRVEVMRQPTVRPPQRPDPCVCRQAARSAVFSPSSRSNRSAGTRKAAPAMCTIAR